MSMTTAVRFDLHRDVLGAGPPVLCIAGATQDTSSRSRLLADKYTTVCYDRRMLAAGLPQGESMSITARAEDAAALVDELGLAPALAFGTSAGGNIALALITRRPDMLLGAIVQSRP